MFRQMFLVAIIEISVFVTEFSFGLYSVTNWDFFLCIVSSCYNFAFDDNFHTVILQWTILALRNLCEGNSENQEVIKNCKKEGVVDNAVLQEMGLTLHENADGQSIRVVPLLRD